MYYQQATATFSSIANLVLCSSLLLKTDYSHTWSNPAVASSTSAGLSLALLSPSPPVPLPGGDLVLLY